MPETFFNYFCSERERLDRELERARAISQSKEAEVGLLQQLRRIVDDQLVRWSEELSDQRLET